MSYQTLVGESALGVAAPAPAKILVPSSLRKSVTTDRDTHTMRDVGGADKADTLFDNPEAKLRYHAYSRLQAAAVAFGESLPIPEIVAIGGQSDGKSSLLEAFLGFRFNVREVEMGTRRPLIVQMVHDPTAKEPRCRLQEEDSDEYGPPIVPETSVADVIQRRTEEHLRRLGGAAVSSKPIIMRAEYAYCPNLTIIDTPGFILKAKAGEADNTPDEIMSMVKAQASPPHRMILFLQQSSVEWASSLWLRVVQEVDPHFQRTVVVASKFDNRLKEFGERWEVDKYLSATGYLPPNVRPFFVALPKDRAIQSSAEWRRGMGDVDSTVLKQLRETIKGGFDEERFGSRVGFANLKKFLEDELARRYREAAPATLSLLQERCDAASSELVSVEMKLRAAEDCGALRRGAMRYADCVNKQVGSLLAGSADPDPTQHGMTTDEERTASRMPQWPGVSGAGVRPPNDLLKLFGGAAFERCLEEFQAAVHALRFPTGLAQDRLANVLLAYKSKSNFGGPAKAAEDLARNTARDLLGPLLDCACARLGFVLRRILDLAADRAMVISGKDNLQAYIAFHAALRSAHQGFVSRMEEQTRALLRTHVEAATSEFATNLLAAMPDVPSDDEDEGDVDMMMHGGGEAAGGREVVAHGDAMASPHHHAPHGRGQRSQLTVPETPSPSTLKQAMFGAGGTGGGAGPLAAAGPGRFEDNTPSRRNTKARRFDIMATGRARSEDVLGYAESLFRKIKHSVAQQHALAALKSSFLDPLSDRLGLEVTLELFGRSDAEFMGMFTAPGVLAGLAAKRDALAKRVEGLLKCKNEFSELARCL